MRARLAFVSLWNAADPNVESGYAYSMYQQLQKTFEVVNVSPLQLPLERLWLPMRAVYWANGQYYHPMREPSVLRRLGITITSKLKAIKPDVIFSPSSLPMSFAETKTPWVFSTDQVFHDFCKTYIAQPAKRFLRLGEAQETRALSQAARASFPSFWAAETAMRAYATDPEKISVIPWGANLTSVPDRSKVDAAIAARRLDSCRLVFLGRDWKRKGGAKLVETVKILNRSGLPTKAAIIGCSPEGVDRQFFDVYGSLNKHAPKDNALLSTLMLESTFFFLPSEAEAYGQAFCEAAAYGLPSIATRVGGIPTIIRNGETGFLESPEASGEEFAGIIVKALSNRSQYETIAKAARIDFETRLNWDAFGVKLTQLVEQIL